AALAAALFDNGPGRYSAEESQSLIEQFRLRLAEDELDWKPQSALDDLIHDLSCLRFGLARLDFENLELKLQTGLERLPEPARVERPPVSARNLIASLLDDPQLGAVARLAQRLLAAVQMPRAVSDPDELNVGGISDISNRGPLDRLLLSELAHDDLTLAV